MSKKTIKPRENPKTLNEWTLELEIASEIKCLFNEVWLDNYPRLFRRRFRLPLFNPLNLLNRRGKLSKLSPREENAGGGWDTKITIPKGYFRDARVFFIQFKRGYSKPGNTESTSIFSTSIVNPNPYIEFSFNSNRGNNQHQALRNLCAELVSKGKSADAVMYAFPRITDPHVFDNLLDSILLHTTFLSINELDLESPSGVDLADGEHQFRTSENDEFKREICSDPFQLSPTGNYNTLLFEIIALKFGRIWESLKIDGQPSEENLAYLQLVLAEFLRINPFKQELFKIDPIKRQTYLYEELLHYYSTLENEANSNRIELGINGEYIQNKCKELFKQVSLFFIENGFSEKTIIQDIPSQYSLIIGDGIDIELYEIPDDFELLTIII